MQICNCRVGDRFISWVCTIFVIVGLIGWALESNLLEHGNKFNPVEYISHISFWSASSRESKHAPRDLWLSIPHKPDIKLLSIDYVGTNRCNLWVVHQHWGYLTCKLKWSSVVSVDFTAENRFGIQSGVHVLFNVCTPPAKSQYLKVPNVFPNQNSIFIICKSIYISTSLPKNSNYSASRGCDSLHVCVVLSVPLPKSWFLSPYTTCIVTFSIWYVWIGTTF